jgi:hypothetical protein
MDLSQGELRWKSLAARRARRLGRRSYGKTDQAFRNDPTREIFRASGRLLGRKWALGRRHHSASGFLRAFQIISGAAYHFGH